MISLKQQKFIYGAIFLLANKLQVLGDQADPAITTKQYFLLVTLSQFDKHEPMLTELAEFMASSRQNIKKIAVLLAQKGMITMNKDPNDARSFRLALTPQGLSYIRRREISESSFYDKLFLHVNGTTMDYLEAGLLRMAENLAKLEAMQHEKKMTDGQ